MSSNAYLNAIDYRCLLIGDRLRSAGLLVPAVVRVLPDGSWQLQSHEGAERVLLLRNRSVWWRLFAVLTVSVGGRKRSRLWLFRDRARLTNWRRISVRYHLT